MGSPFLILHIKCEDLRLNMSKVFVCHNLPLGLGALVGALVSHDRPRQGDEVLLVYCGGANTPMRPTLKILGTNHNCLSPRTGYIKQSRKIRD